MTHHRMRHQMHDAWPALGSWQVQLTKGNVRIGDAERDDAARALGEHFAVGRLDREEYDERMDVVLAARTWGDLAPVFRDLPSPTASAPRPVSRTGDGPSRRSLPAAVPARAADPDRGLRAGRNLVGLLDRARRVPDRAEGGPSQALQLRLRLQQGKLAAAAGELFVAALDRLAQGLLRERPVGGIQSLRQRDTSRGQIADGFGDHTEVAALVVHERRGPRPSRAPGRRPSPRSGG